jgi:hypothetical protein
MEVIAKSGKNRRTESDYIGFLYDRKHQKRYLLPRRNRLIRIAKMKSLIG